MTQFQIAFCEANRELVFREALEEFGMEVYCPVSRIQVKPRHKRKRVIIERAIFPHYVFAEITDKLNDVVRVIPGFLSWLRMGDEEIITVGDEIVMGLKVRELSGEFDRISKEPSAVFAVGTKVKVLVGPMAGFTGVVRRGPRRQMIAKVEINGKIFDIPLAIMAIAL